jgi:hypothetical protein
MSTATEPRAFPDIDTVPMPDRFDGATYDPDRDGERLTRQARLVFKLMRDGLWHTLPEISNRLARKGFHEPEQSLSARLRDLRKAKFGGHVVERRYVGDGLWQYRLLLPGAEAAE